MSDPAGLETVHIAKIAEAPTEPQNFIRAGILVRIDGSCTGRGWERLRESVDEMPAWGIL
jgi:hypothetical protein